MSDSNTSRVNNRTAGKCGRLLIFSLQLLVALAVCLLAGCRMFTID